MTFWGVKVQTCLSPNNNILKGVRITVNLFHINSNDQQRLLNNLVNEEIEF